MSVHQLPRTEDWPSLMTAETADALRTPFPPAMIGKLPRATCRACSQAEQKVCNQHRKEKCGECGAYMTTAHIHLDYVGHAATTDRLLQVDPTWTWEPVAYDEYGAPLIMRDDKAKTARMWIRMTVCGVTRLGVGIAETFKSELEKELISDAIRNAAMRFGVALDLWSKEDLTHTPDDTPTTPPEGWASNEECEAAHADLKARAKDYDAAIQRKWAGYIKDSGYAAPFTRPQYDELAGQLLIFADENVERVGVQAPPAPDVPAGMVPDETSGPVLHEPPETPAGELDLGAGEGTAAPPDSPAPRVDVSEWKRGASEEAKARFDAWRRGAKIKATVAQWSPEDHAAFDQWIEARGFEG